MATNLKLILTNELTGNLDFKNGIEATNRLNQEGTTIIMVIHSDRDPHYVHRVIDLFDGQIVIENCNRIGF